MDRGEGRTELTAGEQGIESVAADASARVGAILAEAEQRGRELNEEAARAAAATLREAEAEVERIVDEAREAARAAARERASRLAGLQAALATRGPALLEGLEGAGMTRARLEALIDALASSAEGVVSEAEAGEPTDGAAGDAPETAAREEADPAGDEGAVAGGAATEPREADGEDPAPDEAGEDPVAAGELAQPFDGDAEGDGSGGPDPALSGGNGDGAPARYDGPLPEGAPLARKPVRSPERDARFAALLLAVQGRERGDVEAHLRNEYGFDDCEPILDEVFGSTSA